MLDALTGMLEGGAPLISRTIGCWVAESEVADLLRSTEHDHAGVVIGSYPFFRDGAGGANFVVRATDAALVDACLADLAARLVTAGHTRSEEHTSELQSLMRISYAVFCLKKKTIQLNIMQITYCTHEPLPRTHFCTCIRCIIHSSY